MFYIVIFTRNDIEATARRLLLMIVSETPETQRTEVTLGNLKLCDQARQLPPYLGFYCEMRRYNSHFHFIIIHCSVTKVSSYISGLIKKIADTKCLADSLSVQLLTCS